MPICMYEEQWVDRVAKSVAEYRSAPEYASLVAEAAGRGYAPAPASLLVSSVRNPGKYNDRLFGWRGGLWVKAGDELLSVYMENGLPVCPQCGSRAVSTASTRCPDGHEYLTGSRCRHCGQPTPCDNDCEELQEIYREQQREKLRDIDPEWAEEYMRERSERDT